MYRAYRTGAAQGRWFVNTELPGTVRRISGLFRGRSARCLKTGTTESLELEVCNVILLFFWISLFAKSHPARLGSSSPLNPLPHATGRHGDEFLLIPYGTLLGQAARLVRDAVLKDLEAAPLLRVVASVLDTGEGKPIARQHCSGQLRPLRSTNLACRLAPPNLHGSLRLVLARDVSPGSYIIYFL